MGHYLLVPNFGVTRVKVKSCPFSTELVFDRGEDWSSSVKTRSRRLVLHVYPFQVLCVSDPSIVKLLSAPINSSQYLLDRDASVYERV